MTEPEIPSRPDHEPEPDFIGQRGYDLVETELPERPASPPPLPGTDGEGVVGQGNDAASGGQSA
jgi:hypothetical protein